MRKDIFLDQNIESSEIKLKEGEYFPLERSEFVYLLKEGVIDLLFYEQHDEVKEKTGFFITSIEKNELIFPPNKSISPPYLFIRAHSAAIIESYSIEIINEKLKDQILKKDIIFKLVEYLIKIEEVLDNKAQDEAPKSVSTSKQILFSSLSYCFKTDKLLNDFSILWLKVFDAKIKINEDEFYFTKDDFLPLAKNDVLFSSAKTEIELFEYDDLPLIEINKKFLDFFYQKIFAKLSNRLVEDRKNNNTRLLEEIAREKKYVTDSCVLLSQVLSLNRDIQLLLSTDCLIKACQHIALINKCSISVISIPPYFSLLDQKMEFICENSNLSFRKVKLDKEIFCKDFAPILVFEKKNNEPKVIVSNGRKKYKLINPNENTTVNFSTREIENFDSQGYVLYKNFPKEVKGKGLFKFILESQGFDLAVIIMTAIVSASFALYAPLAMGWIFDIAVPSQNKILLVQILSGLLMVGAGRAVFSFSSGIAILRIEGKTSNKLQSALWARLLNLKLSFFKNYTIGDLWQRVSAVNEIRSLLSSHTLNTAVGSFFSFFYFGVMLYRSVFLSLIMLIPIILTLLIYIGVISITIKREIDVLNYQGIIYGNFVQVVDSIKKIRMFNAENRAFARWSSNFSIKKRKEIELMVINNLLGVFHKVITNFGTIIMYFVVIGFLIKKSEGKLSQSVHIQNIGEYLSFSAAYGSFSAAIYSLARAALSIMKDILPRWRRAVVLFQAEEEARNLSEKIEPLRGEIKISKISFRYSSKTPYILKDLSFSVRKGSHTGIIGGSGSGKSSLVRLLIGFEKPESGIILFDDRLQENIDIRFLRQQMGVVVQTASIFLGSIRENICTSRKYSDQVIYDVLELVSLKEEIDALPMGLETVLPAGGGTISVSKRQRLLLARGLIQKPLILILDESFSGIDDDMLDVIKRNLRALNMTVIFFTQKVNLVKDFEHILVLSDGKISEEGTFSQLIENKGNFYEILRNENL